MLASSSIDSSKMVARSPASVDARQGEAPNLPAIVLVEVAEGLDEARDQIALREQHVDGHDHVQARHHLVDALADTLGQGQHVIVVGATEVADADRDQDPVDGLLRAGALQHVEEGQPFVVVVVLGRVAPGSIKQDGLVGQPPVAVARAAHAAHGPALRAQIRKLDARVAQRRALPGAGRTDDHVPGQRPQRVSTRARHLRGLEGVERLLELRLHGLDLGAHLGAHLALELARLTRQAPLESHARRCARGRAARSPGPPTAGR